MSERAPLLSLDEALQRLLQGAAGHVIEQVETVSTFDGLGRVLAEEVRTSYGGDLEVFVEKRIWNNAVLRITGSNLLDSSKDEVFDKFDNVADQIARAYDEYELETEASGPFYQVVLRVAF